MSLTPYRERQKGRVLVCDGAMGTMLYARGIYFNRCFDELNLTLPGMVSTIHREYLVAGADILETNTFGANRFRLATHSLDGMAHEINRMGAKLAREVAGDKVYVAGAVGPLAVQIAPFGPVSQASAIEAFREQAEGLLAGGVDLFILETFSDLNEVRCAIAGIREVTDLPIVAQMTFGDDGNTLLGATPEYVARQLTQAGVDLVGANCSVGPQSMLEVLERMTAVTDAPLSAQPNAGKPKLVDGRFLYLSSPEYHAEYAKRFLSLGVSLVGGCCGTTPEHVRAIKSAVRALQPSKSVAVLVEREGEAQVQPVPRAEKSPLAAAMEEKFVVSIEVVPPRGYDIEQIVSEVRRVKAAGVDAVNIPDGPRASARLSPMALAVLLQRDVGIETILHYCCRDRNLLGMQSDLLGAHALGLRNILIITGDPPKLGDYPDATAVFDVDAIGLTRIVNRLNHGEDIVGNAIGKPTAYFIGVGVNPAAMDWDRELERFREKVASGAEYALTQPIFDPERLNEFLDQIAGLPIPILCGILPLTSLRMAEFLNNEIPGMFVPPSVMDRLRDAPTPEAAKRIGLESAREMMVLARQRCRGAYLMPPFIKDKFSFALAVLEE